MPTKDEVKDKRQSHYQAIYQDLLARILQGRYGIGDRLPSERELSSQYGVSRITSKRAMDMLADQGYITRTPGSGSYVAEKLHTTERSGDLEETCLAGADDNPKLIGAIMEYLGPSFGTELLNGIQQRCDALGYSLVLKLSRGDEEQETRCIQELLSLKVQGFLILCACNEVYSDELLKLMLQKFPTIFIDRKLSMLPAPYVGSDHEGAMKELTDDLFARGHRKLAIVMGENTLTTSVEERLNGYIRSCLENEPASGNNFIYLRLSGVDQSREDLAIMNADRIETYLKDHSDTTGFIVINYDIATLLRDILEAREPDWRKHYEIACFDMPFGIKSQLKDFTCLLQNEWAIGSVAAKRLVERIQGLEVPKITYIPHTIVIRRG